MYLLEKNSELYTHKLLFDTAKSTLPYVSANFVPQIQERKKNKSPDPVPCILTF